METGKPLISILMAVYDPRPDWLREQLDSLNAQTYPNLRLYIRDDCSPTVPFEEIRALVRERITAFPYTIERNEVNLGSNGTFERLTREAEGAYFAYCDQDDVWQPRKIEKLAELMEQEQAFLAYCDMSVIDENGYQTAVSLKAVRPRLRFVSGTGLAEIYFFRNCTAGCSMVVDATIAKKAVPFPVRTVCDQWVAVVAAMDGRVSFLRESLMNYRIHGGNQTGVLCGVTDKKSYRKVRLEPLRERLGYYEKYQVPSIELQKFVKARLDGKTWDIWRYRNFSPYEAKIEILMKWMPDRLFRWLVEKIK